MLIIFFCILILNFSNVFPSNYCEIKDILTPNDSLLHCNEDQLVFGSFLFDSEDSNLLYTNNSDYNVKIINNFDKEIIFFLDNNCQKKGVKIKEIINLNDSLNDKYSIKVIISCKFKSNE